MCGERWPTPGASVGLEAASMKPRRDEAGEGDVHLVKGGEGSD